MVARRDGRALLAGHYSAVEAAKIRDTQCAGRQRYAGACRCVLRQLRAHVTLRFGRGSCAGMRRCAAAAPSMPQICKRVFAAAVISACAKCKITPPCALHYALMFLSLPECRCCARYAPALMRCRAPHYAISPKAHAMFSPAPRFYAPRALRVTQHGGACVYACSGEVCIVVFMRGRQA